MELAFIQLNKCHLFFPVVLAFILLLSFADLCMISFRGKEFHFIIYGCVDVSKTQNFAYMPLQTKYPNLPKFGSALSESDNVMMMT